MVIVALNPYLFNPMLGVKTPLRPPLSPIRSVSIRQFLSLSSASFAWEFSGSTSSGLMLSDMGIQGIIPPFLPQAVFAGRVVSCAEGS